MSARKRTGLAGSLAAQLAEEIRAGRFAVGDHLSAQTLADRFGVSRSPVGEALRELAAKGLLRHRAQRGYFVAPAGAASPPFPPSPQDPVHDAYLALAEDRLEGRVPEVVSANLLRDRYGLTLGQVQSLVTRVAGEGWLERRPGYGLRFTAMLTSPDALLQTYRFRLAMEPAALIEPGYELDREEARECRRVEEFMLSGGVESMSMEELYDRGVRFHELIVAGSRNPFFLDALRRINSIRRLLAYRSSAARGRYYEQARDHLEILDLLEAGRNEEASWKLRSHLGTVIHNLAAIRPVLEFHRPP
jgi:DNA-binding GntR family transcriptional regulator